ncbi:hypothetical protein EJB05_02905, partial [Eragrostis curvula]
VRTMGTVADFGKERPCLSSMVAVLLPGETGSAEVGEDREAPRRHVCCSCRTAFSLPSRLLLAPCRQPAPRPQPGSPARVAATRFAAPSACAAPACPSPSSRRHHILGLGFRRHGSLEQTKEGDESNRRSRTQAGLGSGENDGERAGCSTKEL